MTGLPDTSVAELGAALHAARRCAGVDGLGQVTLRIT